MKAKHVQWEPMWEKYFSNYPGLEPVVECRQSKCPNNDSGQISRNTSQDVERYHTSYSITEPYGSSERFHPVDRDSDIGFTVNEAEQIIVDASLPASDVKASGEPPSLQAELPKDITCEKSETKGKQKVLPIRSRLVGKQPEDIIFECGTGQSFAFVTRDGEALTHTPFNACIAKTLGITAIDTTTLKHPKTKVMFSCVIYFRSRAADSTAQLEFVLSRSCNNGPESPIGNWVYDIERVESCSQSFKFNFCSCNSFPGCYNYFVRVLPAYIKNCTVCITNCHIEALAQ